jgi:hypothetical protein
MTINVEYQEKLKETTIKQCSILYSEPCSWAINYGWYDLVRNFSLECENIHILYYEKYRYRIILEQIKEKYGSLRIYFTIIKDPPKLINCILKVFKKIELYLSPSTNDYNMKKICDEQPHKKITFSKIDKKYSDDMFNKIVNVSDVNIKTDIVQCMGKYHYVPQKAKFKYHLYNWFNKLIFKIEGLFQKSSKDDVVYDIIYSKVQDLILDYERRSQNICEQCGFEVGKKYSKKCVTSGWITILCEQCAKKSNREYYIGKTKYLNGNKLK